MLPAHAHYRRGDDPMNEDQLRDLIEQVKRGKVTRRRFTSIMTGLGIAAPMATQLLAWSGLAAAQSLPPYKPTRRGGGGSLRLLWWQAPTLLNPHFGVGQKDIDGSRIFYEPLATWDPEANLVPILASEIPSLQNGGVARDGLSVTWKLKRNVTWHDGKPFTADDVVFTWEYVSDPATAAVSSGVYKEVKAVEKIDPYTVRVVFVEPVPFWARPFVTSFGVIIPKHLFDAFRGAKSRDAPTNLKPVGTGPYKFVDFKPGDIVRGEINPNYHEPNRPYFDAIEMKGGGDAVSAARAVLQTAEFDYAWNVVVEDEILKRLEQGGKGRVLFALSGRVEHMLCNFSDPWTEVDGERSNPRTRHPILSDPAVRAALNLLVDRGSIQEHVYGRGGTATRNFLNNPARFRSPNTKWEFSIAKANQTLDAAGWKSGADGIRARDGKKLKLLFQTSINAPRQKSQQIIKQACQKAGIDLELKSIMASVYFSSDVGNPDTNTKFYADLEMFNIGSGPDPWFLMNQFYSGEIASKENKWQGRNLSRWRNDEYDKAYMAAKGELDLAKRVALFIRMNELVIDNHVAIPLVSTPEVGAVSNRLRMTLSGWDSHVAFLKDWYRADV
jgi:peptide/nickel transport system substrate-binding protein